MSKTDLKQLNTVEWNCIDWRKVELYVFKLQIRYKSKYVKYADISKCVRRDG